MRIREIVLIVLGTLATLTFVGFMFDYYLRTEEVQVIRRKVYYDSLILEQQKLLKQKDSILEEYTKTQNQSIRTRLQYQDGQIKKIQQEIEKIKGDK